MKEVILDNDVIEVSVDDGIMWGRFKVKIFDFEAAKVAVATRIEACKGQPYPLLIDARYVSSITKEARDYFASPEGTSLVIASCLVLDSVLGRFLGNFFLQISKPKVPLKLFTNTEDAVSWLQQFKPKKDK